MPAVKAVHASLPTSHFLQGRVGTGVQNLACCCLCLDACRWRPPANFPASAAVKAEKQLEASRLLTRLEQAKNRGEDYGLDDILLLRRVCQTGGGVTVDARTVGGR